MLPPIRPRPIIAISMRCFPPLGFWLSVAAGGALDRGDERGPALGVAAAEGDPKDRKLARLERLQVAGRLGLLQDAEAVGLAGDGDVAAVLLDDLEEDPDRRSGPVGLPRRVQEA